MNEKPILQVLSGDRPAIPPIWLMRQAGRYLPEYRALRTKAKNFLDFCYNPELAVEATLQPIRRFGFDAAIMFSDILVVPDALGQPVSFVEGEGPRLAPLMGMGGLDQLATSIDLDHLEPVFETLRQLRGELPPEVTLLGFTGAPWTLAGYMVIGRGGTALEEMRLIAYRDRLFIDRLIERLTEASIAYLSAQIAAGAEAVQIFESFAGSLPPVLFERWSLKPIARIIAGVRAKHPGAKVIVFARGAGSGHIRVANETGCDAIGLDWQLDLDFAAEHIHPLKPVQGNLDPLALVAGGQALEEGTRRILRAFQGGPAIFNLGHGILPQTPIAHVEHMIEIVRSKREEMA